MSERDIRNAQHAAIVAKAGGEAEFERRNRLMIQALLGCDREVAVYMLRSFVRIVEAEPFKTSEELVAAARLLEQRYKRDTAG